MKYLVISILLKGWSGSKNFCPCYYILFQFLLYLFHVNISTVKINSEAPNVSYKVPRNPPSCFLISCFTVSPTPSINIPESWSDFLISIISFLPSFKITKVIPLFCSYNTSSKHFLNPIQDGTGGERPTTSFSSVTLQT